MFDIVMYRGVNTALIITTITWVILRIVMGEVVCATEATHTIGQHNPLILLCAVFHQIRHICCAYNSVRCLDLQIWQFLCPRQQRQRRHDRLLYPLCMRAG